MKPRFPGRQYFEANPTVALSIALYCASLIAPAIHCGTSIAGIDILFFGVFASFAGVGAWWANATYFGAMLGLTAGAPRIGVIIGLLGAILASQILVEDIHLKLGAYLWLLSLWLAPLGSLIAWLRSRRQQLVAM